MNSHPRSIVVDAVRKTVDDARRDPALLTDEDWLERIERNLELLERRTLRPVINATGVLLHTNLGRAPLEVHRSADYANIELDLTTGTRGSRRARAGALLARACGAEAALVVNNGAAAMLLALAALARGNGVAVSRGELVEIGGGFRVPEVMAESGARLVEVGTTNRTRRDDYARVAGDVAMLLKVHQSNYRITGFTEETSVADVASIGPPVLVDLGSGLLDAACPWLPGGPPPWLRDEPAVRQTLAAGAALVAFSGDKLLGGPQAGILAGRVDAIDTCARHPLYRALRPGTLVLGALEDVALAYLERDVARLPFWRMATESLEEIRGRAEAIGVGKVIDCASVTGGGTLPGIEIPSVGIALDGDVTAALRAAAPKPVIARVEEQHTILDLRTVHPDDDELVRAAVSRI